MIIAVLLLLRILRLTEVERTAPADPLGAARLHRLCGAPLRLDRQPTISNGRRDSFGQQLLVEMPPAISFALAVLVLQLGLLIALLRYRLYDAEFVISRSANVALITVGVAAVFAGTADGLKQIIYNYYGNTNSEGPIIFAAALSTVLVNPIQERVQRWSEKRFQKNLFLLRDDLARGRPRHARDRVARRDARRDRLLASTAACARCAARRSSTAACCELARTVDRRGRGVAQQHASHRIIRATCASRPTAVPDPRAARPELRRRRADRLSARRPAAGRLDPQPRRAEGADGSVGVDRPRHPHGDQARGARTPGRGPDRCQRAPDRSSSKRCLGRGRRLAGARPRTA